MNYSFVILVTLVLFVALPTAEQKTRRQPNRPPVIHSFFSSQNVIQICPFFPGFGKPEVTLEVVAKDPDGDSLNYEYSNTEGVISGTGSSVIWNLDRLPRGPHKIHVTVTDGKGGKAIAALSVITADASVCDRPPPPCPVVTVSIP